MQLEFLPKNQLKDIKCRTHGGEHLKKRRKIERPLRINKIHHVVFKSRKATAKHLSFYTHKVVVAALLKERGRKYFIEIIDWVNMGNHLHLKVRFKDKVRFKNFLRTFAALLARKITKAHRGNPFGKFWDGLAYTRVLLTAFEELGLRGYFEANHRQREFGYAERLRYLNNFNQFLYRLKTTRAVKNSS
jgi:hypothetical protein